jgi:antitoxin PrlF
LVYFFSLNSYCYGMKAVLSEKGQVTIPKALRDRLGLRHGQVLLFEERGGQIVVSKALVEDPVESVYGILKAGRPASELLAELRCASGP